MLKWLKNRLTRQPKSAKIVKLKTTSAGGQKMSVTYTPALEAKLVAMAADGPVTYAMAVAFADENGLKPRSVIAKVKSMKLAYECKPVRVTKRGEPVVLKGEVVKAIEAALGIAVPSLAKVTKEDLDKLWNALVKASDTREVA